MKDPFHVLTIQILQYEKVGCLVILKIDFTVITKVFSNTSMGLTVKTFYSVETVWYCACTLVICVLLNVPVIRANVIQVIYC